MEVCTYAIVRQCRQASSRRRTRLDYFVGVGVLVVSRSVQLREHVWHGDMTALHTPRTKTLTAKSQYLFDNSLPPSPHRNQLATPPLPRPASTGQPPPTSP